MNYLILSGHPLVIQIGDCDIIICGLFDFMLWPLVWSAHIQQVPQGFIVNFNKAGCKCVLQTNKGNTMLSHKLGFNSTLICKCNSSIFIDDICFVHVFNMYMLENVIIYS